MNKFKQRLKQLSLPVITLTLATSIYAQPVFAATLDDVVNAVNNLAKVVTSTATAFISSNAALIYEANPSLPATVAGNMVQKSVNSQQTTQQYAISQIERDLTQNMDLIKPLSNVTASDTYIATSSVASLFGKNSPVDVKAGNANLSSTSLLDPVVYNTPTAQSAANNYIYFAANLGKPLTTLNWTSLSAEQKQKLQQLPAGQDYRVALRSAIAARSVGINSLYSIFSERMPVANLGAAAGMTTKDASPLQVEQYLATRRTDNPQWYTDMAKASPATIQRETLFVLAEIERQLYQQHIDQERILAALAISQLQNSQLNTLDLQQKEQSAKELLGIKESGLDQLNPPNAEEAAARLQQQSGQTNNK